MILTCFANVFQPFCFSLTHIALPDLLICLEPRTWLLASIGNEVCIPCPGVLGILRITDWLHFAQLVSSSKVELPHPGTKGQLARVVGKGLVPKYFSDSLGQIQKTRHPAEFSFICWTERRFDVLRTRLCNASVTHRLVFACIRS